MPDQVFEVRSGFFDAIDNDRLYTADDMNLPYKRIVADGVFAAQDGSGSTDFQVGAGDGMNIVVQPGNGIFAAKWFELIGGLTIAVPENAALNPRIDSVIAQVDTRLQGRNGNIVYRPGTAAASPEPPEINQVEGVIEYRLANIRVAPGATAISDSVITDLRGSDECPWVTGLINQVDTSTLFNQFNAAYAAQYAQYSEDYAAYTAEQRAAWEAFLRTLTQQLTVQMNVVTLRNTYTAVGSVTTIPIGISSFNRATDALHVYINGIFAAEGTRYTFTTNGKSIILTNAIAAGDMVNFAVLKNIAVGQLDTFEALIQRVESDIAVFNADSGWVPLTLENGAEAFNSGLTPAVRRIGERVYLRGAVKGMTAVQTAIATLAVNYRPAQALTFTTAAVSSSSAVSAVIAVSIGTDGSVTFAGTSASISENDMISLNCAYVFG